MTPEKLAQVANAILERRRRLSSIIQSGDLQTEIGADGFAEALQRRWVVPDYGETGALQVTNQLDKIQEIELAAKTSVGNRQPGPNDQKLAVGDSVTVADGGKTVTGVVKEIRPDGRVVVSFGEQRPTSGKADYAPTEVKKNEGDKSRPASQMPQPPAVGTAHP